MKIEDVWVTYRDVIDRVERQLVADFTSSAPQISEVGAYLIGGGGKRLRPVLVILGAEIAGYAEDKVPVLGSIIETIHTASLLHDDIVDAAHMRRGKPAAHSVWGNEVIVLVGDYMYSNALRIAVSLENQGIMDVLSDATTRMTEAELLQLSKIGDASMAEEDYLSIVDGKTAALMSAACRVGAIMAGAPTWQEEALGEFGQRLGMAFQIADDLLDYQADQGRLGKSLGKDLGEGKITLPVIYLLKQAGSGEQDKIRSIIDAESLSDGDLGYIMELFAKYKTLEMTLSRAQEIMAGAISTIKRFPESRARDALMAVADYALSRNK